MNNGRKHIGIVANILQIAGVNEYLNNVNKNKIDYIPRETNIEKITKKKFSSLAVISIGRNQSKRRKLIRSNPSLLKSKRFKAYKKH